MRNNEHYMDSTAYIAIKRVDKPRKKMGSPKIRPWGDRLTYTVGEVMPVDCYQKIYLLSRNA